MSTEVTLTDAERDGLREAIDADETWRDDCDECDDEVNDGHHLLSVVEHIIAARIAALTQPTVREVADIIQSRAVWEGREGECVTAADRDTEAYWHCVEAARRIVALYPGPTRAEVPKRRAKFDAFLAEQLENPAVKAAYDAAAERGQA